MILYIFGIFYVVDGWTMKFRKVEIMRRREALLSRIHSRIEYIIMLDKGRHMGTKTHLSGNVLSVIRLSGIFKNNCP